MDFRKQIECFLVSTLEDIAALWEQRVDVGPETRLIADIGFSSIDVVDLFALIESKLRAPFPWDQMLIDATGDHRRDIVVSEIRDLIVSNSTSAVVEAVGKLNRNP